MVLVRSRHDSYELILDFLRLVASHSVLCVLSYEPNSNIDPFCKCEDDGIESEVLRITSSFSSGH